MEFKVRTKGNVQSQGRREVYFTCNPVDFEKYFDVICDDIFKTQECEIYYTEDMNAPYDEDRDIEMGEMNLFIVPVTYAFLSQDSRALNDDVPYAFEHNIPVLPILMEGGLDELYADKLGSIEYLAKVGVDDTMISYEEKLEKFLANIIVSDEVSEKIRAAFDAYIFMSYRKKDRKYANELMRIIHNNPDCWSIAIWYDEFLVPGENFENTIREMLEKSDIFTMAVTPSVIEAGNYIQTIEYPAARRNGKDILPIEIEATDEHKIKDLFEDIPRTIKASDEGKIYDSIYRILANKGKRLKSDNPEHNFLVGLAYLGGLEVEKNSKIAFELITGAANKGVIEAMLKLVDMYANGVGVARDLAKAQEWYEKADKRAEELYDADSLELLGIKSGFAEFLCDLRGEIKKALELSECVYEKRKALLGAEHKDTLIALAILCNQYYLNGNYKKSSGIAEKLYEIDRRVLGEENSTTLRVLDVLVKTYVRQDLFEKAVSIGEGLLKAKQRVYGEEAPETLYTMDVLSDAYANIGEAEKAIDMMEKAYGIEKRILGEKHPQTVHQLSQLALMYTNIGDFDKGIRIQKAVVESLTDIYGEEHFKTLEAMYYLAGSYMNFEPIKAIPISEKAYEISKRVLGEDHPDTMRHLVILSNSYGLSGEYEKALEYSTIAYESAKRNEGEDSTSALNAGMLMANVCIKMGRAKEVRSLLEHIYEKFKEIFGENNIVTINAKTATGNAALECGEYDKAYEILKGTYDYYMDTFGEEHPYSKKVRGLLDRIEEEPRWKNT